MNWCLFWCACLLLCRCGVCVVVCCRVLFVLYLLFYRKHFLDLLRLLDWLYVCLWFVVVLCALFVLCWC